MVVGGDTESTGRNFEQKQTHIGDLLSDCWLSERGEIGQKYDPGLLCCS